MSKIYFTERIKDEALVKITDKMLNFEKGQKDVKAKFNIIKIIPAVAAIVLIIGLVNIIGIIDLENLFSGPNSAVATTIEEDAISNEILTNLPIIIEKSVFDNLLAAIPEDNPGARNIRKMSAYYNLMDIDNGTFYVFDPKASEKEIAEILGYWNDYIGWSDADYIQMLKDYQITNYESKLRNERELYRERLASGESGSTVAIVSMESMFDLYEDEMSYWNDFAWRFTTDNDINTFTLKNGTTIKIASKEITNQFIEFAFSTTNYDTGESYGFMEPAESFTVTLANGITITVPGGTTIKAMVLKNADHELEIKIGDDGEATITQPDGTSSTLPSGTVLDGNGNIIR